MIKVEEALKRFQYNDILDVATAALPWGRLNGKTVAVCDASSLVGFYIVCALLVRNDVYGDNIKIAAVVRDNMRCSERFKDLLIRDDLSVTVNAAGNEIKTEAKSDFAIFIQENNKNLSGVSALNMSLEATGAMLRYAEKCKAQSVLVATGAELYGELFSGEDYISENDVGYLDRLDTSSAFPFGERAGEALCALYAHTKKLPVKIARLCNIYGPSLERNSVWNEFLSCAVRGENIRLSDGGADYFSFCYVSDAAEALLTILLSGADAYPYNVSSEYSNVTIREFAATAQLASADRGTRLEAADSVGEKEPQRSYLDKTPEVLENKRLKDLGWVGKTTLKEGIRKSVRILSD